MLREPDNTAGLNHLAAFIETWLAGTSNGGYNTGYDFDSSGFVDMNDLDIMADLYDFEITHPSAYYYLHDALGSTMGLLTDYPKADDWNEFYRYDAWGNITDGSGVENPFLWAGYYQDEETNDYYCMNRYYKPTLARWTQNDPLGTNPDGFLWNTFNADGQYKDGMNLYEYVSSNPCSNIDFAGLEKKKGCGQCFCINNVTYRWKKSAIADQPFVGGFMLIKIHGYWIKWNETGDIDGRAEVHWWEKFSNFPTKFKKEIYEGKSLNTWHDLMHKRLPPYKQSSYRLMNDVPKEHTDEPGIICAIGMGTKEFEARILMAAKSNPKCPCSTKKIFVKGAYIKYDVSMFADGGGILIDEHIFNGYQNVSLGAPWPQYSEVDKAFTF